MIFAVIEKLLFRQKMLLLCSLNPEDASLANGMIVGKEVFHPESARLNEITSPPACVMKDKNKSYKEGEAIEVKDATEDMDEILKAFRGVQKKLKESKKKAYVAPELTKIRIEECYHSHGFWGKLKPDEEDQGLLCKSCRSDPRARDWNKDFATSCVICSANKIAKDSFCGYQSYSVSRRRIENAELALRFKKFCQDNSMEMPWFTVQDDGEQPTAKLW